jgi:pantothenate kinase
VEGNYLLLNEAPWNQHNNLFDELWYLQITVDDAMERVVKRHMKAWGM